MTAATMTQPVTRRLISSRTPSAARPAPRAATAPSAMLPLAQRTAFSYGWRGRIAPTTLFASFVSQRAICQVTMVILPAFIAAPSMIATGSPGLSRFAKCSPASRAPPYPGSSFPPSH